MELAASLLVVFGFAFGGILGGACVFWILRSAGYVSLMSGRIKCLECKQRVYRALVSHDVNYGYIFCSSECGFRHSRKVVVLAEQIAEWAVDPSTPANDYLETAGDVLHAQAARCENIREDC